MTNNTRSLSNFISFGAIFLLIEFFDEFYYAVGGVALPAIQADLQLDYAQVGLILGLPHILGIFLEWPLMLLGDTNLRKPLVIGGGLVLAGCILAAGAASSFPILLAALVISFPASGAFVTLSQATLVDLNPQNEEKAMARWTLAGSLGNLLGPLFLAGVFLAGFAWRTGYGLLGLGALCLALVTARIVFPPVPGDLSPRGQNSAGMLWKGISKTLFNPNILRWIALSEVADLLMDVFTSFLPLYFTNIAGLTNASASLVLAGVMLGGLAADMLVVLLLERLPGRKLLRWSAGSAAVLYCGFLLAPWLWAKIIFALLAKISTLGWYAIIKAEIYAAAPGKSGTVNAINSLSGLASGVIPWLIGLAAETWGLDKAMWLLLLGPICLLLWTPKKSRVLQSKDPSAC